MKFNAILACALLKNYLDEYMVHLYPVFTRYIYVFFVKNKKFKTYFKNDQKVYL